MNPLHPSKKWIDIYQWRAFKQFTIGYQSIQPLLCLKKCVKCQSFITKLYHGIRCPSDKQVLLAPWWRFEPPLMVGRVVSAMAVNRLFSLKTKFNKIDRDNRPLHRLKYFSTGQPGRGSACETLFRRLLAPARVFGSERRRVAAASPCVASLFCHYFLRV